MAGIKLGLHLGHYRWPGGAEQLGLGLAEIARTADQAGFASLWVMDHLFQLGEQYGDVHGPVDDPMLEAFVTVGFMAGVTERVDVGVAVICNSIRPPGLVVKAMSTLDVVTGGRCYLGIGAGWYEREARGLGVPLPATWEERFERLEETLRVAHHVWGGIEGPFVGPFHTLAEPIDSPPPLQRPHPPILIGGDGERHTLRLVATYGDACNFVLASPLSDPRFGVLANRHGSFDGWLADVRGYLRRKLDVLEQHCARAGRSFTDIERTAVTYVDVGPDGMSESEMVEMCGELGRAGIDHLILDIPTAHRLDALVRIGESVVPALAG